MELRFLKGKPVIDPVASLRKDFVLKAMHSCGFKHKDPYTNYTPACKHGPKCFFLHQNRCSFFHPGVGVFCHPVLRQTELFTNILTDVFSKFVPCKTKIQN